MGLLIDMIKVGQGDSVLLTLDGPSKVFTWLIDGGPVSSGDEVVNFVKQYASGHLDVVIGTHLDNDHLGGLKAVVEQCDFEHFYLNLPPDVHKAFEHLHRQRLYEFQKSGVVWDLMEKSLKTGSDLYDAVKAKGKTPLPIVAGNSWTNATDIQINVLNPNPTRLAEAWGILEKEETVIERLLKGLNEGTVDEAPETSAENNASVVLEICFEGAPYALLPADAGAQVLREVTAGRKYPFLKVPHHGSKTGLDEELVKQFQSRTAFISVGDNGYGHPAGEILEMLRDAGASTFCSHKSEFCYDECPSGGFGNICQRVKRASHPEWTEIDPKKCRNNV
jgi:beta-lactamase superfamily II metal-dependent hydrolase